MAVPVSVDAIMRYVQNCQYPTNYDGVRECAAKNNAPSDVLQALKEMKDASSRVHYNSPSDVRDEVERHRRNVSA